MRTFSRSARRSLLQSAALLFLLLQNTTASIIIRAFKIPAAFIVTRHDDFTSTASSSGRRRCTNRSSPLWGGTSSAVTTPPPPRIVSYLKNASLQASVTTVAPATAPAADDTTKTATATATAAPTSNVGGALSMTTDELTCVLGSGRKGRAQLVWDCYAIGIDPALYFGNNVTSLLGSSITMHNEDYYNETTILQALPSTRRHVRLGHEALQKLAQTYATTGTVATAASSDNTTRTPILRVEGGVASLVHVSRSADGTTKMLLQMRDGLQVETVIIPIDKKKSGKKKENDNHQRKSTVCLSSQVGCRQACTFCATGRMGIQRSLTSDEILAQFYFATKLTRLYGYNDTLPRINNVVFMGMGDAADNAAAVTRAVRILTSQFQLAAQKVTVSTVGPTPQAFLDLTNTTTPDAAPCVLAWSVHAANDEIRQRLVPTSKSRGYSVAELRNGLVQALLQKPMHLRTTMLQVTLLKNINDSLQQADEMADLAESIVQAVPGCKLMVNLIPWNDINHDDNDVNNNKNKQQQDADVVSSLSSPLHYQRPSPAAVDAFQQRLWQRGIYAQVRTTRGDDATAACGQLATITQTAAVAKKAAAAAVGEAAAKDD